MKTYHGKREGENDFVGDTRVWFEDDGVETELTPDRSLKVRNHSPTGFNWGYGGSGPAQLALALLLDVMGYESSAETHYMDFKDKVVAGWGDEWEITEVEILSWMLSNGRKKMQEQMDW